MNEWDIANAKREAEERAEARGEARGRAEGQAKGMKEGIEKGKAEGEAKGKAEEKIAIAAKMLKTGLPIDVIVEITGLPEAKVKSLA